jgi:triosephosphate isomerase
MIKTKYFIANWKANKNLNDALLWFDFFLKNYQSQENKIIIICPPFPLIFPLKQKLKERKNLYFGSQDVSVFEEGSYTGEVTAKTLFGLVDFTLIGHSERRRYFFESEDSVHKKINLAKKYQIEPILCISDKNEFSSSVNDQLNFVAYEPLKAIGTGNNETIENILKFKNELQLRSKIKFLYGGSVNEKNYHQYLQNTSIDGMLVGTSSLDPKKFLSIIG